MHQHVEHFTYGWLTPTLSFALSFVGSLLGLICTARVRIIADRRARARWLVLAAWAIGGTGIWTMHFMAMLGFSVPGLAIRYDPMLTVASLLIAIIVVGIGLFIVGYGQPSVLKILLAGLFTGLGVAAMHYTGMAAMRLPADISYDLPTVGLSVVIAVVAATVALWFTVTLRRGPVIAVAAAVMAVAVNGMHFTGMYAMRISEPVIKPIGGILPITFIGPIVIFVVACIVILLVGLLSRPSDDTGDNTLRLYPVAPLAPAGFPPRNR